MAEGLDIIVVTGLSGSGKSHAMRVLEDDGFFCIDNLPVLLIPKFIDLCQGYREEIQKIALGIDLRSGFFFQYWPDVLTEIRQSGHRLKVLFFDSTDEILLRRFNGTNGKFGSKSPEIVPNNVHGPFVGGGPAPRLRLADGFLLFCPGSPWPFPIQKFKPPMWGRSVVTVPIYGQRFP